MSPSVRKRSRSRSRSRAARRWIVLLVLGMVALMGAVVTGIYMLIVGPNAQAAAYPVQGTPLQIRLELRQRSIFGGSYDRTLRASTRDRQRQADLRPDPGGYGRVNLYRQADRVVAVAWGGTYRVGLATGDIEVLSGPVLPESPVGYLGAFDLDTARKVRFFQAADCPFSPVATADRPRPCRG